ncbi:MAG TPA: hypothetical protein VKA37_00435, partial [Halobacteriales archaeon]|nr:hypothetical protein [Halobacteriales archaeon]
ASAGRGAPSTDPANYTRLYVDAERPYLQLKPGESDEFTVTVENGENEAVDLDPHLYVPPVGGPVLEASWVTIDGPDRLVAGEEAEYTVTVEVPDDAEIGHYGGRVAFTDQTVTYPGRPARPVHAEHVRVEVWREPAVQIESRTYVHAQVEAGESITREVVVENTGDEPVPLSPELANQRSHCRGDCPGQFERSWLDVDAPSQVDPGETATVTITISPPADAERGRYDARLDLGLKDPNRDERDTYWQTVDLNVEVWKQPDEPVETSFDVSEGTEDFTVTLRPRDGPYRPGNEDAEPVDFEVELVEPNGSVVEPERVRVTDRGFVDMSGDRRRAVGDDEYVVRSGGTEFVYRIDEPEAGEWTLRVTPENTIGFSYEVTRNEAG